MAVLAAESAPPASLAGVQLAQAVAALRRLSLGEVMTGALPDPWEELEARRQHAAGTLETIARLGEPPFADRETCPEVHPATGRPCTWLAQHGERHRDESGAEWVLTRLRAGNPVPAEPVMELLESAWSLIRDRTGTGTPEWEQGAEGWRASYADLVARRAAAEAEPAPLIPDGTYVHVAVKGFLEREGYLTTGEWLGDLATAVLRDGDGEFSALIPRGSVHLITAADEPGSGPVQPDPWAQVIEEVRADAVVLKRNWHADRDKIAALRQWAESFLAGDDALAEVMAIFNRDFRRSEGELTGRPPF